MTDLQSLESDAAELRNEVAIDLSWVGAGGSLTDLSPVDVRLQVQGEGGHQLHVGSAQYDTDHSGYWGSGTLNIPNSPAERVALAHDLVEQVLEDAAQQGA